MQTGEGKTLTALLPAYVRGVAGKGMHMSPRRTIISPCATRQRRMRPVYEMLGLSVGTVTADTKPPERRAAYRCDVTYGTAKEFGFDFLRDLITSGAELEAGRWCSESSPAADSPFLQRPASMLVDEPTASLSTSAARRSSSAVRARRRAGAINMLSAGPLDHGKSSEGPDFINELRPRRLELTADGRRRARETPEPAGGAEGDLSCRCSTSTSSGAARGSPRSSPPDHVVRENAQGSTA